MLNKVLLNIIIKGISYENNSHFEEGAESKNWVY